MLRAFAYGSKGDLDPYSSRSDDYDRLSMCIQMMHSKIMPAMDTYPATMIAATVVKLVPRRNRTRHARKLIPHAYYPHFISSSFIDVAPHNNTWKSLIVMRLFFGSSQSRPGRLDRLP
jgi:hypothetical protein